MSEILEQLAHTRFITGGRLYDPHHDPAPPEVMREALHSSTNGPVIGYLEINRDTGNVQFYRTPPLQRQSRD